MDQDTQFTFAYILHISNHCDRFTALEPWIVSYGKWFKCKYTALSAVLNMDVSQSTAIYIGQNAGQLQMYYADCNSSAETVQLELRFMKYGRSLQRMYCVKRSAGV